MEGNLGRDRKIIDRLFSDTFIFRLVHSQRRMGEGISEREWNIEFIIKYNEL